MQQTKVEALHILSDAILANESSDEEEVQVVDEAGSIVALVSLRQVLDHPLAAGDNNNNMH